MTLRPTGLILNDDRYLSISKGYARALLEPGERLVVREGAWHGVKYHWEGGRITELGYYTARMLELPDPVQFGRFRIGPFTLRWLEEGAFSRSWIAVREDGPIWLAYALRIWLRQLWETTAVTLFDWGVIDVPDDTSLMTTGAVLRGVSLNPFTIGWRRGSRVAIEIERNKNRLRASDAPLWSEAAERAVDALLQRMESDSQPMAFRCDACGGPLIADEAAS